jgi:hypothetical protein
MPDITLCIITKGREQFLAPLLMSLDKILLNEEVKVLAILNGVSSEIEGVWKNWEQSHPGRVVIKVYQVNKPGISHYWPIIRDTNSKWIAFPSDDDILSETFFKDWVTFERDFENFGAVATSLRLIDSTGSSLGVLRKPEFSTSSPLTLSLAKSLSECPFLWPGLVIKVKQLPKNLPHSRYVADWWLGLYLFLTTSVTVTNQNFVQYRVHSGQESAISSLSRKNLEALIHIGELIKSNVFAIWINERSESEVIEFLQGIVRFPPIYGDAKCSSELVSIITSTIINLRSEKEIQFLALRVNAYVHDVLVDDSQLGFLGNVDQNLGSERFKLNFGAEFDAGICSQIEFVKSEIAPHIYDGKPIVRIGCRHSVGTRLNVKIDCVSFTERDEIVSHLLARSTEYLQSIDAFRSEVSPFEYFLIKKLRMIRTKIPKFLNKLIYHRIHN